MAKQQYLMTERRCVQNVAINLHIALEIIGFRADHFLVCLIHSLERTRYNEMCSNRNITRPLSKSILLASKPKLSKP